MARDTVLSKLASQYYWRGKEKKETRLPGDFHSSDHVLLDQNYFISGVRDTLIEPDKMSVPLRTEYWRIRTNKLHWALWKVQTGNDPPVCPPSFEEYALVIGEFGRVHPIRIRMKKSHFRGFSRRHWVHKDICSIWTFGTSPSKVIGRGRAHEMLKTMPVMKFEKQVCCKKRYELYG